MKELPQVTVVLIDCHNYGQAIAALKKTLLQIKPAKAVFLTDVKAYNSNFAFEVVKSPKIKSKKEYSEFVIKELYKYFDTEFVLVIQHDGYVLDGEQWDDRFLEYDYIGAPWLESDGYNVGNGGFSLRSKKLLELVGSLAFFRPYHPEDAALCRTYRPALEEHGIKFAPEDLAEKFSYELREPSQPTFGFHGKFHKPFSPTVVVKRSGALGDIIATEPLLDYYHKKGYNVAIDMPVHLCLFFGTHFFPIKHIGQLDGRIPTTVIDLDGAYENNPKQLHLKSYYEKAGIVDGEIRNPKLKFPINDGNKLFKKFAVIHLDRRDQASRNVYNVFWPPIIEYLKDEGYEIFQVGQYDREQVAGAIEMATQTVSMLQYAIASADLFIGVDSGPSTMAVALNVPSVIFFGSVNPEYIHPDLSNICVIHRHDEAVCEKPFCWSETVGSTTGTPCYLDDDSPPCTKFDTDKVLEKIKTFVNDL